MSMTSKGMVQVDGTTYRIVERPRFNEVVRLLDDRVVAAFRHAPTLELVHNSLPTETMLEVVQAARATGRLTWRPRRRDAPQATSFFAGLLERWRRGALRSTWHLLRARQLVPVSGAFSLLDENRR